MRINCQPAYVLHQRAYRDSSLLLELFTAEQGRLSLVARGVKRRARGGSSAALLQPFAPLLVSFSGRSELKNLTAVESAGSTIELHGRRLFSGLYVNELLVRLLHRHDPYPRLFASYGDTLNGLAEAATVDASLRRFEYMLLEQLGYGFKLDVDAHTGAAVAAGSWYSFETDRGFVANTAAADSREDLFAGTDLLAMAAGQWDGAVKGSSRRLLRLALAAHLGGVPLRSRDLFPKPRKQAAADSALRSVR